MLYARAIITNFTSYGGPRPTNPDETKRRIENNGRSFKSRKTCRNYRITIARCFTTIVAPSFSPFSNHKHKKTVLHFIYYRTIHYSFILFPIASHNVFICFHSSPCATILQQTRLLLSFVVSVNDSYFLLHRRKITQERLGRNGLIY